MTTATASKPATTEKVQHTDTPDILRQLVAARRKAKITQAQIAAAMNTTASAVARLESGGGKKRHSPSIRTIKLYAAALNCDIKMELVPLETAKNDN